jgi:hypothetical protein
VLVEDLATCCGEAGLQRRQAGRGRLVRGSGEIAAVGLGSVKSRKLKPADFKAKAAMARRR